MRLQNKKIAMFVEEGFEGFEDLEFWNDDLVNAGATWVDEPAFRDGNIVWGRVVEDIPAFCRELVSAIEQA